MNSTDRIDYLFDQYLNNTINETELKKLLVILDTDELIPNERLKELWEANRGAKATFVNWQAMLSKITVNQRGDHFDLSKSRIKKMNNWFVKIAVTLVLISSITLYFYMNRSTAKENLIEASVPVKQKDEFLLPDGTRVIVNAGSKLTYPKTFAGSTRTVYLEGEAYFDVVRNPEKPFIVHAGGLITKVLGTAFNIHAYDDQSRMEVTVIHGKVEVEDKRSGSKVQLVAQEKVQYNVQEEKINKIEAVDTEKTLAWNRGNWAFEDANLVDISKEFYRRYGQEIILANPDLKNCYLNLSFNEDNPQDLIKLIASLSNATYSITNNKFILSGKGCPVMRPKTN